MKITSTLAVSCGAFIGVLAVGTAVLAQTAAQTAAETDAQTADAKAKIWAKEQSIYAERASGGLSNYVNATAPNYLAWPPFSRAPFGLKGLRDTQPRVAGAKERITSEFKDFTRQGDTAVIYYINHRTRTGDGAPVDQYFENIHVWVRIAGDWKVLGGMSRLRAPDSK